MAIARGEEQWVVSKELETLRNAREATGVERFDVVAVMADTRAVTSELTRRYGMALIGKRHRVALDRRIELELAGLVEARHRGGRDWLGDAADPEACLRACR